MNQPISEDKKCPNCGSDKYVISIFGSICPVCLYDPKKDGEPNHTPDTSDKVMPNTTDTEEWIDDILWSAIMHEPAPTKDGEEYKATWNEPVINKAKQSILTYISDHYIKIEDVEKIIGQVTPYKKYKGLSPYEKRKVMIEYNLIVEQRQRLDELRGKK